MTTPSADQVTAASLGESVINATGEDAEIGTPLKLLGSSGSLAFGGGSGSSFFGGGQRGYWIGLYGTLHDIRRHVEENHRAIADHLATFKNPEKSVARLAVLKERLHGTARIRDVFQNQDDCIVVQFMRNVYSHPLLDNYAVDVRGDKLKGQLMHTLIGKVLSVEETDAAVDRVFRRYASAILRGERADSLIARDFAKASLPAQEALAALGRRPTR